jgi:hypothetical protein
MATKEELYISIPPLSYKANKSNILMAQASLLQTLKKLHNLRVLSRRKRDLKLTLQKKISTVLSQLKAIQNKMPEPKIPKSVQKIQEPEPKDEPKKKIVSAKKDKIEDELTLINEKLQELNA